jgi:hypothetical protein
MVIEMLPNWCGARSAEPARLLHLPLSLCRLTTRRTETGLVANIKMAADDEVSQMSSSSTVAAHVTGIGNGVMRSITMTAEHHQLIMIQTGLAWLAKMAALAAAGRWTFPPSDR